MRSLPDRFKIDIRVKAGSHESENSRGCSLLALERLNGTKNDIPAVNKQLNDNERVAAALENNHLLEVVHECLRNAGERGGQRER